jgi:enterochelin esterase-like enzyme/sugar lactone lactonase YvrE
MTLSRALALLALALGVGPGVSGSEPAAAPEIIQRIRGELSGPLTDDSKPHPGIPKGETIDGVISDSRVYPGTENHFRVYVPAQYNPATPACLVVRLDGIGENETTVFDNLIAKGDMPVAIGVGISSGVIWKTKGGEAYRWNRSYEFDSTNGNFPRFVLEELLPRVETLKAVDGRQIRLSHDGKDRAVTGASTGGIGSFTLAWERPDAFSRVYSVIGTFVSMRGGHDYPALVRKAEPKAVRIFLEDGSTDAWNPLFGSWYTANLNMEAALAFAGYDVEHAWGEHGHDGGPGNVILPDVMRWLWRGWPAPVQAGVSANDKLAEILRPGEAWQRIDGDYRGVAGLASNPKGEVFFSDTGSRTLYRVDAGGAPEVVSVNAPPVGGRAFGPDGTLYATVPSEGTILATDAQGRIRRVAEGIRGGRILATAAGELYVSEPGVQSDEPCRIWLLKPDGARALADEVPASVTGIAFSPDKGLFFAAERSTARIDSSVAPGDGVLQDREPFYWLHAGDAPAGPGTEDVVVDTVGSLYAATPLGIQVCDRNGRVRAILWLPSPSGPVEGLCWGGAGFDMLFATDGRTLYRRHLRVPGFPQWSQPVALPKANAG